jgi:transcriptional regulator with PAS, ATPase and Fis domain
MLILGETGTGKELLARAIHHDSAAPAALRGGELRLHPRHPDRGRTVRLRGRRLHRRTPQGRGRQDRAGQRRHLFLDEIGDMPLALQAHLLRVLQERQVTPLGSSKPVAVDVAIICATHRNLREMIAAQLFREDLFYRLNGLAVRLPPLRERSDLLALVERILRG